MYMLHTSMTRSLNICFTYKFMMLIVICGVRKNYLGHESDAYIPLSNTWRLHIVFKVIYALFICTNICKAQ